MAIGFDGANLASIIVQALLYGCFVVLFIGCLWALLVKRSTPLVNKPMLTTACLIFVLATAHLAVCWSRARDAFVVQQSVPFGASLYYSQIGTPKTILKGAIFTTQIVTADSLLVYRCFIVWSRNIWIVVLPSLMVVTTAVMGILFTYELSVIQNISGPSILLLFTFQRYFTTFFALTLCVNVILTSMIALRIWLNERALRGISRRSLRPLLNILIESGSLYCATIICIIILYFANSNMQFLVQDAAPSLIGITFSLIIIRVAMGFSQGGQPTTTFRGSSPVIFNTRPMGLSTAASGPEGSVDWSSEWPDKRDGYNGSSSRGHDVELMRV